MAAAYVRVFDGEQGDGFWREKAGLRGTIDPSRTPLAARRSPPKQESIDRGRDGGEDERRVVVPQ